jgi:N-acylglucosamine 2-epimerase
MIELHDLYRDGTVSTRLKGNVWKGSFHLPRLQWFCWRLLDEMIAGSRSPVS